MEDIWNGFSKPTTTPVPDELFDVWLPELSGSELKVLLYVIRRTFGFKKDDDAISLSQICSGITTREGNVLDRGTGLARTTASKAVKKLEALRLIVVKRSQNEGGENDVNTYRLRFRNDGSHERDEPADPSPDRGSAKNEPGVVRKTNHPWCENLTHNKQPYKKQNHNKQNNHQHHHPSPTSLVRMKTRGLVLLVPNLFLNR